MANAIDYNGQDKWKQKATELLNQGGGGGGGNVDDVKVDGVSVVDANKVAQIDMTPYVKSADLAAVATSGSYNDLNNKPTIPAAQVQSDWAQTDTTAVDYIKSKPNTTYTGNGNIAVTNNVVTRKEVWLTMAEYTALQNPDANTDYHITDGTVPVAAQIPITVVNGKLCYVYKKEVS